MFRLIINYKFGDLRQFSFLISRVIYFLTNIGFITSFLGIFENNKQELEQAGGYDGAISVLLISGLISYFLIKYNLNRLERKNTDYSVIAISIVLGILWGIYSVFFYTF